MYHNSAFVNPPHTLRCVIHQYIVLANNNNNSTLIACQCNNGNDGVRSTATRIGWKRAFQLVYIGMHASELMRRMIHFIIYILQQTRISSIVYVVLLSLPIYMDIILHKDNHSIRQCIWCSTQQEMIDSNRFLGVVSIGIGLLAIYNTVFV